MESVLKNAFLVPGNKDVTLKPLVKRSTEKVLIFCHSGGGSYSDVLTLTKTAALVRKVVESGYTLYSATWGNQYWGNDASLTLLNNAITAIGSPSQVGFITTSQGSCLANRYAKANPTKVKAIASFLPAFDLDDLRVNDRNGARALIDAAYGVVYPAALPVGVNTALDQLPCPSLYGYSTDDPYVPTSVIELFSKNQSKESNRYSLGALGHTDAAIGAISKNEVAAFFRKWF